MSQIFGKYLTPCDGSEKMSDEAKEELKKNIKTELKNN